MQLDKIAAVIRPRNQWEAIDLGFLMARRWWRPLLISWLLIALPVMVLCTLIFHDSFWISITLFWLLKPLYEQAPLVLVSRALFDDMPERKSWLREIPHLALKQSLLNITWRRFSFSRGFNAPVAQLEGLKGKARQQRLNILQYSQGASSWLTIIGLHFEFIIYLSCYVLLIMLIPGELASDVFLLLNPDSLTGLLIQNTFYFLAAAIIAPFYIAGGFALYLNRRVALEGWDIELAFRKLQQRNQSRTGPRSSIKQVAMVLLLSTALLLSPFTDIQAQEDITPEQAKATITQILAGDDFGEKKTSKEWVYIGDNEEEEEPESPDWDLSWLESLGTFISQIAEILLWVAVGLVIYFIIANFTTWGRWLKFRTPSRSVKKQSAAPTVLFGMEVTEESLPDNLIEEVRHKITQGDYRGALSLLYRGSLVRLMLRDQIIFSGSFTEGECIALVERKHPNQALVAFFRDLTQHWICMAYAHQPPDQDTLRRLCDEWPDYFERRKTPDAGITHG